MSLLRPPLRGAAVIYQQVRLVPPPPPPIKKKKSTSSVCGGQSNTLWIQQKKKCYGPPPPPNVNAEPWLLVCGAGTRPPFRETEQRWRLRSRTGAMGWKRSRWWGAFLFSPSDWNVTLSGAPPAAADCASVGGWLQPSVMSLLFRAVCHILGEAHFLLQHSTGRERCSRERSHNGEVKS